MMLIYTYLSIILTLDGEYRGEASELSKLMRPFLVELILNLVQNDIMVAIVTFSSQSKLIQSVLELLYPKNISSLIELRCNDNSWDHGSK